MKKLLCLVFLSIFLLGFTSAADLFYDDFEAGDLSLWTVSGEPEIKGGTTYVYEGDYSVLFNGNGSSIYDEMVVEVNVEEYSDIILSYYRMVEGLESEETFYVGYSFDGSTWNTLENVVGEEVYDKVEFGIPVAGESTIYIKFYLEANAKTSDFAALDNVLVQGGG